MQQIVSRYLGMLPYRGYSALDVVGFPHAHKAAFEQVALSERCVVMSREVGPVCTQLIEEGYDSKGFRIHAKSCDWGPMAGFVCRDPDLNKKGAAGREYNSREHEHALNDTNKSGWKASTVPICLSEARLDCLRRENKIQANELNENALEGTATHATGISVSYLLRKEKRNDDQVWALYYKPKDFKPVQARVSTEISGLEPIEAMVNPYPAWPAGHYKNGVTGDYDLFAIWPSAGQYASGLATGEDRRVAGMGPSQTGWKEKDGGWKRYDKVDIEICTHEDPQIGNISNRGHLIAQMLNSVIGTCGGCYVNRHMVHHSDEGGRPFVNEVDLPLIGFVPAQGRVLSLAMTTVSQVQAFTALCAALGYVIILNKGWISALGFYGSTGGQPGWRKQYTWTNR